MTFHLYFQEKIFISGSPKQSTSRQNSRDSVDEEVEYIYDDGTKSRNPVRRSNSSPEMSASWKNPFLHQKVGDGGEENPTVEEDSGKKNKAYTKDPRLSCEAIPEEIAGLGKVVFRDNSSSVIYNQSTHKYYYIRYEEKLFFIDRPMIQ